MFYEAGIANTTAEMGLLIYLSVLEHVYSEIRLAEGELDLDHLAPVEAMRRIVQFTFRYYVDHESFVRLVIAENQAKGRHLKKSKAMRTLNRPILAVVGVLLIVSTVLFAWSDRKHDWRYYQYAFKTQVAEKYGVEKARTVTSGVQQIWVPDLRRADRCVTCHQAVYWKGFETAEEPYRSHPAAPLKNHSIERFGCTACHGGQGYAVDAAEAHGPVEHWEEPLLGSTLGEAYTIAENKKA